LERTDDYSVELPADFADRKEMDGAAYFGYSKNRIGGQLSIAAHSLSSPCTSDLTGASQMRVIAQNPDILVGTVDAWDSYRMDWPNQQEPLCKLPPRTKEKPFECPSQEEIAVDPMGTESQILGLDCPERWRAYEKEHGLRAGYTLCSQRGDKTVVICLQQMKDDPKMADEIFSTLRWIEE
jgi:hypothetical protein